MSDNRAISNKLMELIAEGGKLHSVVDFVRDKKELELCFRGNSSEAGMVCVYYNNFIVYRISGTIENPKIVISTDQGRYSKNWKSQYEKLGLTINPHKKQRINTNKKTKDKHPYVISYTIEQGSYLPIQDKNDRYDYDFWKNSWKVLRELLDDYLYPYEDNDNGKDEDENKDKYTDWYRKYCEDCEQVRKKHRKTEKIAQQRLFTKLCRMKESYYLYDLEYIQKGDKSENKNKPDALAIEYDSKGIATALVFVEVKSTRAAIGNINKTSGGEKTDSSLLGHLMGMISYIKQSKETGLIDNRLQEVKDILDQYKMLKLRNVEHSLTAKEISNLKENQKILVIFTDDAKKCYESDEKLRKDVDEQIKVINEDKTSNIFVDFKLESDFKDI